MTLSCQIKFYEETNCLEASVTRLRAFARYFHRSDYPWAKEQKYASSSGVYFLFGPCDEFPRRFYIGQAEIRQNDSLGIVNRMNEKTAHERINDWTDGVMFVCTDNYFNENPLRLRYLENHLWKDASCLHPFECSLPHTYQVVTRSEPRAGFVGEEDQETLDEFIQFCKLFLKLAGFPIYCSETALVPQTLMCSNGAKREMSEQVLQVKEGQNLPQISHELVAKDERVADLSSQPPVEAKVQEIYHHSAYGNVEAQLYFSEASGDYVLCAGAELKKLTTAKSSTRVLREGHRLHIDANNRTTTDIHFPTRNQAALFVCGTETVNANVYWQPSKNLQGLKLSSIKAENVPTIGSGASVHGKVHGTDRRFYLRDKEGRYNAQGYLEADNVHFTVLAGSKLAINPPGIRCEKRIKEKRKLFSSKISNNTLLEDITFDKCSPAAEFVMYRSANGKTEWKDVNGRILGNYIDFS